MDRAPDVTVVGNISPFSATVGQDAAIGAATIWLRYQADDPRYSIEVAVAPTYGSNLFRFRVGDDDIITCNPALLRDRDWTGAFVLWPIPNRVREKQFEFQGRVYSLRSIRRKQGNDVLIHGLVDDQVWRHSEPEATTASVSVATSIAIGTDSPLYSVYPFLCSLTLRYTLRRDGVQVRYTVTNQDTKDLPFGFALHPYFATLGDSEYCYITLPGDASMEADDQLLPSGTLLDVTGTPFDLRRPTPVSALQLDHVFTKLHRGEPALIDYRTKGLQLRLSASPDFTHMVLYTLEAERGFICFENQTGSTDMINLHTRAVKTQDKKLEQAAHLLILPPGESHSGFIDYQVSFASS